MSNKNPRSSTTTLADARYFLVWRADQTPEDGKVCEGHGPSYAIEKWAIETNLVSTRKGAEVFVMEVDVRTLDARPIWARSQNEDVLLYQGVCIKPWRYKVVSEMVPVYSVKVVS